MAKPKRPNWKTIRAVHDALQQPRSPHELCAMLKGRINAKAVLYCLKFLRREGLVTKVKMGKKGSPHAVAYTLNRSSLRERLLWASLLMKPASRQERRKDKRQLEKLGRWAMYAAEETRGIDWLLVWDAIPMPGSEKQNLAFFPVLELVRAYKASALCLPCLRNGIIGTAVYDPETGKNYCGACGAEIIRE